MTNDERNRLDVIEGKIDLVLFRLGSLDAKAADHESRMRSLEKWKLSIPISVLLAIATIVGGVVARA